MTDNERTEIVSLARPVRYKDRVVKSRLRCSCFKLCLTMRCVGQRVWHVLKYMYRRNLPGNLLCRQPMQLRSSCSQDISGSTGIFEVRVIIKQQKEITPCIFSSKALLLLYSCVLVICSRQTLVHTMRLNFCLQKFAQHLLRKRKRVGCRATFQTCYISRNWAHCVMYSLLGDVERVWHTFGMSCLYQ